MAYISYRILNYINSFRFPTPTTELGLQPLLLLELQLRGP